MFLLKQKVYKYNTLNICINSMNKANEGKVVISPKLLVLMSSVKIPLHVFHNNKLSPLEDIVVFLKEDHNLTYREISLMINRDERNVWAVYHNAEKKK